MKSVCRTPMRQKGAYPMLPTEKESSGGVRLPDMADIMARLHFSTGDGRIWMDDQRMLLVHARALGSLRRELIESLGMDAARGFLTRMGYQAGAYDAQMARKVRSKTSIEDMFVVGPQMHCLEGIGLSEIVRLDFDIERGAHYGEFLWTSPVEDEEHIRHFSIGREPMCWMQIGYASGFSTEFMGRPVLYREVECQSMGQDSCRIVGKTVQEWGEEAVKDLIYFSPGGPVAKIAPSSEETAMSATWEEGECLTKDGVVGMSPGFNAASDMVMRVAGTQATVLFLGETGVGKEVFARMLHRLSTRADKDFVTLNCAAIPEQLIESELFGAERGAYTGALQARLGRFERANGGTLFLDEIGTLSPLAQGKLLRALQEGEIERLGDNHTRKVDVRVIAATNVDLREEVKAGRFREDLFFRLNVFPIRIPPLRERREDIPPLMNHFFIKFSRMHGRRLPGFTQRAMDAMMSYDWPGNIREVENVIERGVILGTENRAVDVQHLFTNGEKIGEKRFEVSREGKLVASNPFEHTGEADPDISRRISNLLLGQGEGSDRISLDEIETMLLKNAVERANGNLAAAARLLGITRPTMVYRLRSRGIAY